MQDSARSSLRFCAGPTCQDLLVEHRRVQDGTYAITDGVLGTKFYRHGACTTKYDTCSGRAHSTVKHHALLTLAWLKLSVFDTSMLTLQDFKRQLIVREKLLD